MLFPPHLPLPSAYYQITPPLAGISTQHLPALSTAIAITVGVVLYFGGIRRRLLRGAAGPPTTPKQL